MQRHLFRLAYSRLCIMPDKVEAYPKGVSLHQPYRGQVQSGTYMFPRRKVVTRFRHSDDTVKAYRQSICM